MNVLTVENVSKQYRLHRERRLFGERLRGESDESETFWALRDVSFAIKHGESFGVVGHNGAGKSSLLSVIAGTVHPSEGRVIRVGRVGGLLELGSGFHPDLTGLENIRLNASLLGMSRAELEQKLDAIIEFSELEQFINEPLRTYSSGMMGRLGFAVAVHYEPEVMLLDEVLAVGDAHFQQKCADEMKRLAESHVTFIFVSHNLAAVSNLCERSIRLDHGRLVDEGPTIDVVERYQASLLEPAQAKLFSQ